MSIKKLLLSLGLVFTVSVCSFAGIMEGSNFRTFFTDETGMRTSNGSQHFASTFAAI